MDSFTVEELKDMLRTMKIKDSTITLGGKKSELIERITANTTAAERAAMKPEETTDTITPFYADCQIILEGCTDVLPIIKKHKALLIEHTSEDIVEDLLTCKPRVVASVFTTVGLIMLPEVTKKADAKKYKNMLLN